MSPDIRLGQQSQGFDLFTELDTHRSIQKGAPAFLEAFLHNLALEEHTDGLTDSPRLSVLSTRKELIRGFSQILTFRDRYQEATRFHLIPHSDQELRDFRRVFVGAMFQGLALNSVSATEATLLSDEVLKFYQEMYPKAQLIEHPLGTTSLAGIALPDGLGVRIDHHTGKTIIANVYECTLTNRESRYKMHYTGFLIRKERFPEIFADSQLVFITPQDSRLPYSIRRDQNVRVVELAITRRQFRNYIEGIYQFYRPGLDGPTLVELQDWARFQFRRAGTYESGTFATELEGESGNGDYTKEYIDYLSKVGGSKANFMGKSG